MLALKVVVDATWRMVVCRGMSLLALLLQVVRAAKSLYLGTRAIAVAAIT